MLSDSDVVIVSISGVQAFIEQSRTTRDAVAGSEIMSALAAAAMSRIQESYSSATIVSPGTSSSVGTFGSAAPSALPNRIVVLAPRGTGPVLAEAAAEAVRWAWRQMFDGVFTGRSAAATANFPAIQWVAQPAVEGDTYSQRLGRAQRLMAARKLIRTFDAVATDADARDVCSLSPQWKSVRPPGRARPFERAENLSSIQWVKRLYHLADERDTVRAPSTSGIASAPFRLWVAAIIDAEPGTPLHSAVVELRRAVAELRTTEAPVPALAARADTMDPSSDAGWLLREAGSWVYPTRWSEDAVRLALKDQSLVDYSAVLVEEGRTAARALARAARNWVVGGSEAPWFPAGSSPVLTPYFAIVAQDIDDLGSTVGRALGGWGTDFDDARDAHRRFSSGLVGVAGPQRSAVVDHLGFPVYAGGDDVLAFAPVVTALACAAELNRTVEDLGASLRGDGVLPAGVVLHASSAILLVHASAPLAANMRAAHRLLDEQAKKINPSKHGLAVAYAKRSGSGMTMVRRWPTGPDEALSDLVAAFRAGLSRRVIADVERATYGRQGRRGFERWSSLRRDCGVPDTATRPLGFLSRLGPDGLAHPLHEGMLRRIVERHLPPERSAQAEVVAEALARLRVTMRIDGAPAESIGGVLRIAHFVAVGGVDHPG